MKQIKKDFSTQKGQIDQLQEGISAIKRTIGSDTERINKCRSGSAEYGRWNIICYGRRFIEWGFLTIVSIVPPPFTPPTNVPTLSIFPYQIPSLTLLSTEPLFPTIERVTCFCQNYCGGEVGNNGCWGKVICNSFIS